MDGTHTILHYQLIPMVEDALLQRTQVQSAYLTTITLSPPGVRCLHKRRLAKHGTLLDLIHRLK